MLKRATSIGALTVVIAVAAKPLESFVRERFHYHREC
jgi:hypothetical protein